MTVTRNWADLRRGEVVVGWYCAARVAVRAAACMVRHRRNRLSWRERYCRSMAQLRLESLRIYARKHRHPHRPVDVLEAWRAAERRAQRARFGTPEWLAAYTAARELRTHYHATFRAARRSA